MKDASQPWSRDRSITTGSLAPRWQAQILAHPADLGPAPPLLHVRRAHYHRPRRFRLASSRGLNHAGRPHLLQGNGPRLTGRISLGDSGRVRLTRVDPLYQLSLTRIDTGSNEVGRRDHQVILRHTMMTKSRSLRASLPVGHLSQRLTRPNWSHLP